jgi:hypothetical protein
MLSVVASPGAYTIKRFTAVTVARPKCFRLTFISTLVQYLQARQEEEEEIE